MQWILFLNNLSPSIQTNTEKVLTKNNCQKYKTVSICSMKIHVTGEHIEDRKLRDIIEIPKITNVKEKLNRKKNKYMPS